MDASGRRIVIIAVKADLVEVTEVAVAHVPRAADVHS